MGYAHSSTSSGQGSYQGASTQESPKASRNLSRPALSTATVVLSSSCARSEKNARAVFPASSAPASPRVATSGRMAILTLRSTGLRRYPSNPSSRSSTGWPGLRSTRLFPRLLTRPGAIAWISERYLLTLGRLLPQSEASSPAVSPSQRPEIRLSTMRCACAESGRGSGASSPEETLMPMKGRYASAASRM